MPRSKSHARRRPSEWGSVSTVRWRGSETSSATALRKGSSPSPVSAEIAKTVSRRAGLGPARLALGGGQQVDLVPDLQLRRRLGHAQILEDARHVLGLLGGLRMRDVAHVKDQVGVQNLLERGAEGGHKLRRQVRDEAHRVRQDHLGSVRQPHGAHGRVERGEEHVLGQHLRAGQPV